jgi:hypothetical protein
VGFSHVRYQPSNFVQERLALQVRPSLGANADRQGSIPANDIRYHALWLADDLNGPGLALDFLPRDPELHFGQPVADAAVNAETKGDMLTWTRTVNDEAIRGFDRYVITAI